MLYYFLHPFIPQAFPPLNKMQITNTLDLHAQSSASSFLAHSTMWALFLGRVILLLFGLVSISSLPQYLFLRTLGWILSVLIDLWLNLLLHLDLLNLIFMILKTAHMLMTLKFIPPLSNTSFWIQTPPGYSACPPGSLAGITNSVCPSCTPPALASCIPFLLDIRHRRTDTHTPAIGSTRKLSALPSNLARIQSLVIPVTNLIPTTMRLPGLLYGHFASVL